MSSGSVDEVFETLLSWDEFLLGLLLVGRWIILVWVWVLIIVLWIEIVVGSFDGSLERVESLGGRGKFLLYSWFVMVGVEFGENVTISFVFSGCKFVLSGYKPLSFAIIVEGVEGSWVVVRGWFPFVCLSELDFVEDIVLVDGRGGFVLV